MYEEVIKKAYDSCKRLENIVTGIISNLEDERYRKESPMSKQLALASKATSVLASILELSQMLKSEGAGAIKEEDKTLDPRIPGLLERIRRIKESGV